MLLGLDLDGTLEVSNCFALPNHLGDDEDKSAKGLGMHLTSSFLLKRDSPISARYQASMLRSLKEVQADDNVVGFYQAMSLGSFYNQSLVDTQAIQQERLRHGGIILVHGTFMTPPRQYPVHEILF